MCQSHEEAIIFNIAVVTGLSVLLPYGTALSQDRVPAHTKHAIITRRHV
jgi:hypothetical protein